MDWIAALGEIGSMIFAAAFLTVLVIALLLDLT